jgi:hypothetical protein
MAPYLGSKLFEFFLSAAKLTKLDVEEAGTSEGAGDDDDGLAAEGSYSCSRGR